MRSNKLIWGTNNIMTTRCSHCKNIIHPYTNIYCKFDKKFCSNKCSEHTTEIIEKIDPEYAKPYIWHSAKIEQQPSIFISIIISLFSYF